MRQEGGGDGASVGAQKQLAPLKILEVTTDRIIRDAEMTGKIIHTDLASGFH